VLYGVEQNPQQYIEYAVIKYHFPFSLYNKMQKSGNRKDTTEDDIFSQRNGYQHTKESPDFSDDSK